MGLWRDRRLVGAVLACWVLWVVSLAVSADRHLAERSLRAAAVDAARTAWLDQGERNPHDAGHWGTFLYREHSPLAILDPGIESAVGSWIRLETHTQHDAAGRPLDSATEEARWSGFHPALVFGTFVPLLLLVLVHGSLCSEREDGRLPLLLASGLTPGDLVRGKLGAALVSGAVVVGSMLVTGAVTVLALSSGGDLVAVSAWIGTAALYALVWLSTGLVISALCATRERALALCVGLWFLAVVALPRVAVSVAEGLHPAASAWHFARSIDRLRGDRWIVPYRSSANFSQIYARVEAEWMAKQGVEDPKDLTVDPFGFAIEETEEEGQRAYDQTFGDLVETFAHQDRIRRRLALLSPTTAYELASRTYAESDLAAHRRFQEEAEDYRREMMRTLNLAVAHRSREHPAEERRRMDGSFTAGRGLWESIPTFEPRRIGPRTLFRDAAPEFGILVVQVLAAALTAGVLVRRVGELR